MAVPDSERRDLPLASATGNPAALEQGDPSSCSLCYNASGARYLSKRGAVLYAIYSFVVQFYGGGVAFMWGTFLEALCHDTDAGTSAKMAAAIGASSDTISFFAYFVAGQVLPTCGIPPLAISGGILVVVGLVSSAFVPTVPCLFITFGLFVGAGRGLTNSAAQSGGFGLLKPRHLKVASGIGQSGIGLGWLAFTDISHIFIAGSGWQRAFLPLAAMTAALLTIGSVCLVCCLRERAEFNVLVEVAPRERSRCTDFFADVVKILQKKKVPTLLLAFLMYSASFDVPMKHLANYADGVLGHSVGSYCTGLIGLGSGLGRVAMVFIMEFVSSLNLLLMCVCTAGISVILLPCCTMPTALMVFSFVYGVAAGGKISIGMFVASDFFGEDLVSRIWSMVSLVYMIGPWMGSPLAGWYYDRTGAYAPVFFGTGVAILCVLLPFLLLRHWHLSERQAQGTQATLQESPEAAVDSTDVKVKVSRHAA